MRTERQLTLQAAGVGPQAATDRSRGLWSSGLWSAMDRSCWRGLPQRGGLSSVPALRTFVFLFLFPFHIWALFSFA